MGPSRLTARRSAGGLFSLMALEKLSVFPVVYFNTQGRVISRTLQVPVPNQPLAMGSKAITFNGLESFKGVASLATPVPFQKGRRT